VHDLDAGLERQQLAGEMMRRGGAGGAPAIATAERSFTGSNGMLL
jgi:hypothetical protein